jgi:hypothetical protein
MPLSTTERVTRWRKNLKAKIVKAMGGECICCGYNKCNDALDLHHLDPTKKEFALRDIISNPKKWEVIKEEMKKCILLCKICHVEYHAGVRILPTEYKTFDESRII